jgi:hypothetical protein
VDLFILMLATWRLTSLVVKEDGPWNLLAQDCGADRRPLRRAVGAHGLNIVAELTCMWCTSVWVGAAFSFAY